MYAIVDVETTGNHRGGDRIIEIAIIISNGEKIISEYQSLVNPQKSINPYVENMTGITHRMVEKAPVFGDIAKDVAEFLEGHIFVAHNVSFDYSLVEGELARAGISFLAQQIDTINYARRIFQGLPSYSLGKLCDSIGVPHTDRHRAYGDTLATTILFHKLLANDSDQSSLKALLQEGLDDKCLPPLLTKESILALPTMPGVLRFSTNTGLLFAIEATKNIRKKAIDKLQLWFYDIKEKELFNSIEKVEFILTGNELIAKLIKEETTQTERPILGKVIRQRAPMHAIILEPNSLGIFQLKIQSTKEAEEKPHILFTSKTYAKKTIEKLMAQGGFYDSYNAIIDTTDERLLAARIAEYNVRIKDTLLGSTFRYPNMIIVDKSESADKEYVLWIENGKYKGWAKIDANTSLSKENLKELIAPKTETSEVQKAIRNHLKKTKVKRLIKY